MLYLQVFFNSLFLTLLMTPFFITYLVNRGIDDLPGEERKIHTQITPRMGGLIVYLAAIIVFISFYNDLNSVKLILVGSAIILICGVIDDMVRLESNVKFVFQFIASIFIFSSIFVGIDSIKIAGIVIPNLVAYLIIMIFLIGSMNSINLMDGLDGLVSGYSLVKFFVVLVVAIKFKDNLLSLLLISIIGSLIGFIKYNAFPARIFLGDTGSLSIGYFLVWSVIRLSKLYGIPTEIDLMIPFILLSTPNLDTIRVMIKRIIDRKSPFSPDRGHLHHLLLEKNIKQKSVVFIIHLFSVLYSILALVYMFYDKYLSLVLYVCILVTQIFLVKIVELLIGNNPIKRWTQKLILVSSSFQKSYKYMFLPVTLLTVIYFVYSIYPQNLDILRKCLYLVLFFNWHYF